MRDACAHHINMVGMSGASSYCAIRTALQLQWVLAEWIAQAEAVPGQTIRNNLSRTHVTTPLDAAANLRRLRMPRLGHAECQQGSDAD